MVRPSGTTNATTSSTALRASTHLLDRIMDSCSTVLRLVEPPHAAQRRIALVRELAQRLPLHVARGVPQHIACRVEELARRASGRRKGAQR